MGDVSEFVAIGFDSGLLFILAIQSTGCYRSSNVGSSGKHLRPNHFCLAFGLADRHGFSVPAEDSVTVTPALHSFYLVFLGLSLLLSSRVLVARKLGDALTRGTLQGRRAIVIGDDVELADTSAIHLLQKYGSREIGRFQLPPGAAGDDLPTKRDLDVLDDAIDAARVNQAEIILLATALDRYPAA